MKQKGRDEMGFPAHVVLIEKNTMMREKLAGNISAGRGIKAVTQVASLEGIRKSLGHLENPLVMMNIDEGARLVDIIKRIKRYNPEAKILLYQSVGVNAEYRKIAIQMGADCFIALDTDDDIVGHIERECRAKREKNNKTKVIAI